ncbi:unnamed protein product [Rhizopus stolonifer]
MNSTIAKNQLHYFTYLGSPYDDFVGFIGGTLNPVARPVHGQRASYNDHTSCGSIRWAIHDQNMFDSSEVLSELHKCLDFHEIEEKTYTIYGDSVYREDRYLIKQFRTGNYPAIHSNSIT